MDNLQPMFGDEIPLLLVKGFSENSFHLSLTFENTLSLLIVIPGNSLRKVEILEQILNICFCNLRFEYSQR